MTELLLGALLVERSNTDIVKSRLKKLSANWEREAGKCILYVMSRDQRVSDNYALLAAQKHAIKRRLPLAVVFVLYAVPAQRAREHYAFMLNGLLDIEAVLKKHNIPFIAVLGEPADTLHNVFFHYQPAAVYFDFNSLKGPQELQRNIAKDWPTIVVDTHNVVPVWLASEKQEIGARTLRPKIHKLLDRYLVEPEQIITHPHAWPGSQILPLSNVIKRFSDTLATIPSNGITQHPKSGEQAAQDTLHEFLDQRFAGYAKRRNNPTINGLTNLSPYFHFGQINSIRVILEAHAQTIAKPALQEDFDRLLEEIIVRKELSDNFCYYNQNYATLNGAPEWARKTLKKHEIDPREYVYTQQQFEQAETHDSAWNAAQRQLRNTGKIHGYMRMYWAKKVLEWSKTPESALKTLIYLNDFYSIDGGDPNGYVGILWSIAGLHDRPWGERSVYGTVRSMVYSGLKKKFDIAVYIDQN